MTILKFFYAFVCIILFFLSSSLNAQDHDLLIGVPSFKEKGGFSVRMESFYRAILNEDLIEASTFIYTYDSSLKGKIFSWGTFTNRTASRIYLLRHKALENDMLILFGIYDKKEQPQKIFQEKENGGFIFQNLSFADVWFIDPEGEWVTLPLMLMNKKDIGKAVAEEDYTHLKTLFVSEEEFKKVREKERKRSEEMRRQREIDAKKSIDEAIRKRMILERKMELERELKKEEEEDDNII